jgi:hypothetical protein
MVLLDVRRMSAVISAKNAEISSRPGPLSDAPSGMSAGGSKGVTKGVFQGAVWDPSAGIQENANEARVTIIRIYHRDIAILISRCAAGSRMRHSSLHSERDRILNRKNFSIAFDSADE